MPTRRIAAMIIAATLVAGAAGPSPVSATVSIKDSSVSCSLTAVLPSLSKTKQLTGSAKVSCLAAASTSVQVAVQVVELDGTTVDYMGGVYFISASKALSRSTRSVSWTVTTPAKPCVNADGAGREDYYTIAVISANGMTRSERIGKIDGWSC